MKKLTLATIKSFIRKNDGKLLIKTNKEFNHNRDIAEETEEQFFIEAKKYPSDEACQYSLGYIGIFFAKGQDAYSEYEDEHYRGYSVSNCSTSFTIAIKKAA